MNTSSLSLTHSDILLHLAPLYKVRLHLLYAVLCAVQQVMGPAQGLSVVAALDEQARQLTATTPLKNGSLSLIKHHSVAIP